MIWVEQRAYKRREKKSTKKSEHSLAVQQKRRANKKVIVDLMYNYDENLSAFLCSLLLFFTIITLKCERFRNVL